MSNRIITIHPVTGEIVSVLQVKKQKVREYLFNLTILSMDCYGNLILERIVFFREVEVNIIEDITDIFHYLQSRMHVLLG